MRGAATWVGRWLREPLVQFMLAGAVLFLVYGAFNPVTPPPETARHVVVDADVIRLLDLNWRARWGRAPTEQERRGLVDLWVRDEILYREGLALGLDKDDTIVKRRVAQKMAFIAEDVSGLREPSDAELKAWYATHGAAFATPGLVTFQHLYFSPDARGWDGARGAAGEAMAKLAGKRPAAIPPAGLGDRFMFANFYAERDADQIASVFGGEFAAAMATLLPGGWRGPVRSGLGWHLVWIDRRAAPRTPPFEAVDRSAVRAAWLDGQRTAVRQRTLEVMKAKYQVVLPAGYVTP